jgi:hypothetical protein
MKILKSLQVAAAWSGASFRCTLARVLKGAEEGF